MGYREASLSAMCQEFLTQAPESSHAWAQHSLAESVTSSSSTGSYQSQNHSSLTQSVNYSASDSGTPSGGTRNIALPQLFMSMDVDAPVLQAVPSGLVAGCYGLPYQADMPAVRMVTSSSVEKASKERRAKDAPVPYRCPLAGCDSTFTRETNLTRAYGARVRPPVRC
jgi:hypothetical protein